MRSGILGCIKGRGYIRVKVAARAHDMDRNVDNVCMYLYVSYGAGIRDESVSLPPRLNARPFFRPRFNLKSMHARFIDIQADITFQLYHNNKYEIVPLALDFLRKRHKL